MGFGFGGKKGNARRRLGAGVRPIDRNGRARIGTRRVRAVGDGVRAIDTPIRAVGRPVTGTTGTTGRVGRPVKSINRKTKGADDIFDPMRLT